MEHKTTIPAASHTVSSLPTPEDIATMSATDLSRKILRLCDVGTHIRGDAVFHVNEFLSHAAVRLARLHTETVDGI